MAAARSRADVGEARLGRRGVVRELRTLAARPGLGCIRAAWSDPGLRELELARQRSVTSEICRLACPEPVEGDRIAWTEAAGLKGEIRTIEAVVSRRTADAVTGLLARRAAEDLPPFRLLVAAVRDASLERRTPPAG